MAERDYAFKVPQRSEQDNYRKLKNFTNRKNKAAEALYYKNLIKSAQDPKEMWPSLNSLLASLLATF